MFSLAVNVPLKTAFLRAEFRRLTQNVIAGDGIDSKAVKYLLTHLLSNVQMH